MQFFPPPRQLGIGRQRIAGDIQGILEFLQQREPRHRDITPRRRDEDLGDRPLGPAGTPFFQEAVEGSGIGPEMNTCRSSTGMPVLVSRDHDAGPLSQPNAAP